MFSVSSSIIISAEEMGSSTESSLAKETASEEERKDDTVIIDDILSFSCYFDNNTKTVNIKGTMNHDAFTSHKDSIFVIYQIPPGRQEIDVLNDTSIKPIAEAAASITFAFSFEISNIIERYSRYAIFMRSPDGEYTLTTKSQYAEITSTHIKRTEKTAFKGISGNYDSFFSDSKSKKVILPIYLDSIISSDVTKYIYQTDDIQTYFNVAYLETLDSQIQSLSFNNSDIYLQFLIRPNSTFAQSPNANAEYILPNTYKYNTITTLHNITSFLISRYNEDTNNSITGIILGKAWDNAPKYNSFKDIGIDDYVNLCGQYIAIISNAAWTVNTNIDIALSLSADGFFNNEEGNVYSNNAFSAKDISLKLMEYLDVSTYSGIPCSIFVEAYTTPLDLTTDSLNGIIDTSVNVSDEKFYIGNQKQLSTFFTDLSGKYKSASPYYNVIWIPDKNLTTSLLNVSYAYAFYSLLLEKNVTGFIVDFSQFEAKKQIFEELSYIFKNIDTNQSYAVTNNILQYFGKEKWEDVFNVSNITLLTGKDSYQSEVLATLPENIKGEFYYFNFANEVLAQNWYTGVGCTDVKIDYSSYGKKALHSDFSFANKDFCDLIYKYTYAENVSYTPYLKINLEILSEKTSPLYEIKFAFQNDDAIFETKTIVKGNEQTAVILDISQAKNLSTLNTMKISVRSLDDSVNTCSLWVYDITGHSEENTTENLNTLIQKERDKIKKEQNEQINPQQKKTAVLVISIIAASTILGLILVLLLQRNGKSKRTEE